MPIKCMFKSSQLQKEKKKTRDLTGFRMFNQLKNMRMTVKL